MYGRIMTSLWQRRTYQIMMKTTSCPHVGEGATRHVQARSPDQRRKQPTCGLRCMVIAHRVGPLCPTHGQRNHGHYRQRSRGLLVVVSQSVGRFWRDRAAEATAEPNVLPTAISICKVWSRDTKYGTSDLSLGGVLCPGEHLHSGVDRGGEGGIVERSLQAFS